MLNHAFCSALSHGFFNFAVYDRVFSMGKGPALLNCQKTLKIFDSVTGVTNSYKLDKNRGAHRKY